MRRRSPVLFLLALLGLGACAPEGPSAFVTFNLKPDASCIISAESGTPTFIPIGRYDISPGGNDDEETENCNSPYVVHLLVNSFLRSGADPMLGRAEPNILQLKNAEVKLMSIQRQRIDFNRTDPALPNPFLVTTNNSLFPANGSTPSRGIAAVEVIPSDYAAQLDGFIGGQILAEIQIFGTTTGDVDVDFKPFVYPIEICYGCYTLCATEIPADKSPADFYGTECADNAGADGRVCIDPDC